MSDNFKFVQVQPFSLSGSGAIAGATSLTLKSFQTIDGVNLAMTDFGTIGYGTIEPGNGTLEEQISFTGVTQNASGTATLTDVKTVLFISPYTEFSGLAKTHAGSTSFIISNTAGFYNSLTGKADDETITGTWTFTAPAYPKIDDPSTGPIADGEFAPKKYVDDIAIAGAPKATNSTYGITRLSLAAASPTAPIAVGDNDTRVPTQGENDALVGNNTDIAVGSGNKFVTQTGLEHNAEKYAVDNSGSSTAYTIALSPVPTSQTDGMVVYAKLVNANTTTTPTLSVNSLTARTIVKGAGTALAVGDIAANQLCTLIYDLTNTRWVLQNPTAITSANVFLGIFKNGASSKDATDASTTQNIAHGLGVIPKNVRISAEVVGVGANSTWFRAETTYNGSTQASLSIANSGTTDTGVSNAGFVLNGIGGGTGSQTGVVTFDATNIIITWTKSGSPAGGYLMIWEAMA